MRERKIAGFISAYYGGDEYDKRHDQGLNTLFEDGECSIIQPLTFSVFNKFAGDTKWHVAHSKVHYDELAKKFHFLVVTLERYSDEKFLVLTRGRENYSKATIVDANNEEPSPQVKKYLVYLLNRYAQYYESQRG